MKILLTYDPPPIPDRNHDWRAIEPDTYDAEIDDRGVAVSSSPIGWGQTPEGALSDLLGQIEDRRERLVDALAEDSQARLRQRWG